MKFVVSSSALLRQVQQVIKVVPTDTVLPILECIFLQVRKKPSGYYELFVLATDLEISMSATLDIEARQEVMVAVPAKLLRDVLKSLQEQPITFSVDEAKWSVEIVSDKGRCKMYGYWGGDFPKYPTLEETTPRIAFPEQALQESIRKNLFAVGKDELRPALTGMLVNIEKDRITFVATEAHKLACYTRTDFTSEKVFSFILPGKVMELLKCFDVEGFFNGQTTALQGQTFFFFCNNRMLACRVIDAKYPDYKAVIPTEPVGKLSFTRELTESLNRVMLFANEATHQVVFTITGNALTLFSEDFNEVDTQATEKLACSYEGPDMEIGFNALFLKEALEAVGNSGTMELLRPSCAVILRPEEKVTGTDYFTLVMPVMLYK